jgi:hypothetical protein
MNKRGGKSYFFKTGRLEQLEPRNMLSGHPVAAPFSAAAFGFHPAIGSAGARAATAVAGNAAHAAQTALTASLTDPNSTATGTVTYQTGSGCGGTATTSLTVSVTGAAASSSLDIVIGGVTVGTLTTNSSGAGSVVFSSNPAGTELVLPTNLPSINLGTTITVGSLSGTFANATSTSALRFARHG